MNLPDLSVFQAASARGAFSRLRRPFALFGLALAFAAPLVAQAQQALVLSDVSAWGFQAYNPGTGDFLFSGYANRSPYGVAISGSSFYMGVGSQVNQYSLVNGEPIAFGVATGISTGQGLAIAADHLYVADIAGWVRRFSLSGGLSEPSFIQLPGMGFGVSLLGTTVYVGIDGTKVGAYSAIDGSVINSNLVTGLANSYGLTALGDSIYVAHNGSMSGGSDSLRRYNAVTGALISEYAFASPSNHLRGVATDGNAIYVMRTGVGMVATFTPELSPINLGFLSGLTVHQHNQIAVSAVPEPSTYAAILGAVGLAATFVYRRRRR